MNEEVLSGIYLCKMKHGVAYYLVDKEEYDQIHTQLNGQNARLNSQAYRKEIPITHLLHGGKYGCQFHKIELVNWGELPRNYQLDAIAKNEDIRRVYHEKFYEAQNNQMSNDLRNELFGLVDNLTGQLCVLKPSGVHNHVGSPARKIIMLSPESGDTAYTPTPHTLPYVPPSELHRSILGQTTSSNNPVYIAQDNTKQMDLLSNIPGMSLDFGKLQKGLIALSFNGDLAFSDKKGGYVTIQQDGTEKTRVDVGALKFDVDFYKVPTQELEEGDVILLDNEFLIAGKKTNGDIAFISPLTGARTNKLQRSNILGMYFYIKIVSLFDMVGGNATGIGLGGLNPMTLMLLSGNGGGLGEGTDIGKLLLFSQMGQGKGDMQSMLPLLLMSQGNNGTNGSGIEQMLMLQAMNGNKGGLGGLFGGKKKAAAKPVVRTPAAKKPAHKKTVSTVKG